MTSGKIPALSKSRFLSGLQCHLRLWHSCFNRGLAGEIPPAQQAIFDVGHRVGELATQLFPGGVPIREDHLHHEAAVRKTRDLLQDPEVASIYEAAFYHDDVRVRVDILDRSDNGQWNMIEVKSSTSVKDVHLPDVAVQYYVLKGCGVKVDRTFLLLINSGYVYDGNRLDLENLFSFFDVTEQALSFQHEIPLRIDEQKKMLGATGAPSIRPSRHCLTPFPCEFWGYCTRDMPEHWILHLHGISRNTFQELAGRGVADIRDIPESFTLTGLQGRMRDCVKKNETFVSDRLHARLADVEYPVHFLDFETVNPAIPIYPRTSPYQIIPFQWSDHVLYEDGTLAHEEYLCDDGRDPREDFVRTLLKALGRAGTIFIYTPYEKTIVRKLADHFPQHREELLLVHGRFRDLCEIIKSGFYHPGFRGSFSLKSVLPVLVPEMGYDTLSIQDGIHAALEYQRLVDPATSPAEKEKIKENLRAYCRQDTLAMLKIRDRLKTYGVRGECR